MFRYRKTKVARFNSGQSTIEYIVLVAAVIAAVIIFFQGQDSVFKKKIGNVYNKMTDTMDNRASDLSARQSAQNFDPAQHTGIPNYNVSIDDAVPEVDLLFPETTP